MLLYLYTEYDLLALSMKYSINWATVGFYEEQKILHDGQMS